MSISSEASKHDPLKEAPLIRADRIEKRYGIGGSAVSVLRNVSFEIAAGEFVAIMGPSGSGKSSLMNMMGLLDEPSAGTLWLSGVDTTQLSNDAHARMRSRHIGFIFQSYHLLPRRTALANVELPLIYQGVSKTERRQRAEQALAHVDLSMRKHAYPNQMSGGEQQRVAIARALVTRPQLILADEPTGALDTSASNQVIGLLETASAEDRAVLLVTHDPKVALRASRVIVIRDGEIVDDYQNAVRPNDISQNHTGQNAAHQVRDPSVKNIIAAGEFGIGF